MSSYRNQARYFDWLSKIVEFPSDDPSCTHRMLMEYMDSLVYSVVTSDVEDSRYMDINRLDDGLYLRTRYGEELFGKEIDFFGYDRPCSWLEMLVAFSERTFHTSLEELGWDSVSDTFREILENIDLWHMTDEALLEMSDAKEVVFETFTEIGLYDIRADGFGGLFPMGSQAPFDCRKTQLWDQMNAYIQVRAGIIS